MEEGFPSSRENPRSVGFPAGGDRPPRPQSGAEMAPAAPSVRPTPPILDRFRAMLREREEELREATGEDRPPPPSADEIVRLYEDVLAELTFNSKPVITELTIIAGQHLQFAEGIADAICARILEVPVDQKLPSLYLLDSIVKNIGSEYVRHFAARLPKVFFEAYSQVHPSQYSAMRHLFGTWWQVFPASVLCKIEDELQFSPSESRRSSGIANTRYSKSPSPRPSHGIHVNPKYLEARRRIEHSATDVQNARVSSNVQVYGQKSSTQFGEYDFDHPGVLTPRHATARPGSPRTAATRITSVDGAEGSIAYPKGKISRLSSPPRIGMRRSISPPCDRYTRDASPRRVVERASPSNSGYGYGPGRLIDHNGRLERSWPSDEQLEASMSHNFSNGYGRQRSRELIDAYGNHRGKGSSHEKLPKVQRLDVNGVSSEAATRNWKNSEEEEYVWEDMSPTLADRSTRNSMPPYEPSTGNLSKRATLSRPNASLLESDFGRRNWPGQAPLSATEDPTFIAEDRILSGHGVLDRRHPDVMGSRHESLPHHQVSCHSREPGILPYMLPQSSQQSLSPRSRGRASQVPFAGSRLTPSIGQKLHLPYVSSSDVEMPFWRSSSVPSDPLNMDSSTREKHLAQRPRSPPLDPLIWPPVHKSQPPPLLSIPPNQKQLKNSYDLIEHNKTIVNQGTNPSLFLPQQQNNAADRKTSDSNQLLQLPYQQNGLAHLKQQRQEPGNLLRIQSQEAHGSYVPAPTQFPSHSAASPRNHVQSIGHGLSMPSILPNPLPGVPSSVPVHLNMHGGVLPPLPPGPPPASSHMGPISQNTGSTISAAPATAFSGLISTLMAQGLISLTPPAQSQDSVGVDFNPELLKVRYESAINALYSDLPRQCTTCGLRFKCQEEHSNHMDWHVTKNRISKNRKQKPSRKWFVSAKEWLSGAETLGNDVVPGFLPTEAVPEKKEDTEMAVPADENQNVCALCGEPFEDFYSDETEEWMYRGAVYMNAPDGYIEGLDRSHLGPIVHAKCRSESTDGSGQA